MKRVGPPAWLGDWRLRPGFGLALAVVTLVFGAWAPRAMAIVDFNTNALDDVWEQLYGAEQVSPTGDEDADGQTNEEESRAGTDPRDPKSSLVTFETRIAGPDVVVKWAAQPGKSYRVLSRTNLGPGPWQPLTGFVAATAVTEQVTLAGMATGSGRFFRVEVTDTDTDNDGVSDWNELRLPGFDPTRARSADTQQTDLETLSARLAQSTDTLSVTAPVAIAIEKEAVDASFRITRAGGLKAVRVRFSLGGNVNAQKGAASTADYSLRDAGGNLLGRTVEIPFGAASVDVTVRPSADALTEVPETLTLSIAPDAAYAIGAAASAAVAITDAANTTANERLFVAYPGPAAGSSSTASGLSTVRLQGDNSTGIVGLSFSGLAGPQTVAFLELNNSGSGVYVKGLPNGQVVDNVWAVKAAAFLGTDQAMLDALFAGQVGVVVNTSAFLDGEIRRNYVLSTGSTRPPAPGEAPALESLTGDALKRDVARFLTQATFGPTEAAINALTTQIESAHSGDRIAGYRAWIQQQWALDQTRLEAYTLAADAQEWSLRGTDPINYTTATGEPLSSNRRRAWWIAAVSAQDQLRQRLGFAWSEIFVISEKNTTVSDRHYGAARYYDQLGAGADGNFRALLETVSKSPMMGSYLSHLKNQKAITDPVTGAVLVSPDENFAREIMQLFTIGLARLHPDGSLELGAGGVPVPTYTNTDITELARVFTGWSFSKRHGAKADGYPVEDNPSFTQNSGPRYFQTSWLHPMKNFASFHDTGAKTVLGQTIPAGLDGEADLDAALDILFNHPNVAPFISRLLIQRLVTSTPSAGYLHRVAQKFLDDGTGTRGNLRAVTEAILLDPEARNLGSSQQVGYGKQKEPLIRYVQLIRAFSGFSQLPLADLSGFGLPADQLDNFPAGATRMRFNNLDSSLAQTPLGSPTVFNWFLPGYSPGGAIAAAGLVAPEMQLTTETQVVQAINMNRTLLNTSGGQGGTSLVGATVTTLDDVRVDRAPWEAAYNAEIAAGRTVSEAVTALVDRLDLLLMSGRFKTQYGTAPLPNPRASVIDAGVRATSTADRVANILYLMANSPEYLHQK